MVLNTQLDMTVEAFDEWAMIQDTRYEYIAGEIVEVSSNYYASKIAAMVLHFILAFVLKHKLGHVTGADGGFRIAGERYIPDVAFISYAKQPTAPRAGYLPNPPDLAVEVISNPANSTESYQLRVKINNYLLEGVVVWVINPETEQVEIYRNNHPVEIIGKTGIIRGHDVLPNFELAVKDIFEGE
ncbi:MAG: Uma2 family endonuclease [Phototrophicales bacterium]|nr:Uma2 family endonuclease [Phototrophicales bacterium]